MSQGLQASEQESGKGLKMVIGQAPGGRRERGGTVSSYQDTLCLGGGVWGACQGGLGQWRSEAWKAHTGV